MKHNLPRRWGLTGPHPNPLSDVRLVQPCGLSVSLHRYAGRWVVVRVTEQPPDADRIVAGGTGMDFVALNVVAGQPATNGGTDALMYDPNHQFAHRFPALDFPATYVIDPDGRLIAVLDDQGWPDFLDELLRQTGPVTAHGAIDQQDIRH